MSRKNREEAKESASSRLRKSLYSLWDCNDLGYSNFEDYYAFTMEQFIKSVQARIKKVRK